MSCRSSRLPLSLSNISPSLAHSNSRYVCLQCRYRASLQKAPPRHPRNGTYSSLLLRRTYATGKKPAGRIEKFQDAVTVMLSKTFFKEGHQPHLEEQAEKADRPDQPPEDPVPAPVVDDPDYAPAVSGEDLETIGGPTGWWEEAWDAEHQYYGFMRPIAQQKPAEIQSAIERALVEAVMLTQAPQGSQLRSAIDDARRQMKKLGLGLRSSQRRSLAVNAPRPSDVPAVKGFKLWQTGDGEIKLEWRRQEDEADMCRFLETALQESMKVIEQKQEPEQEEQEQEDKQEDVQLAAEDGVELQEEEGVLQPETDGPAKSVYTLVADADQSRVPKTGDAPESTGSQTELAPDGSSDVEGPSTPKPPKDAKSFSGLQKPLDLKDPELKFAVVKRAMQLTGIRIPDPTIQSIKTSHDLHRELNHKPKATKLAQILLEGPQPNDKKKKQQSKARPLKSLPNVKVLPTKQRQSMTESALGRQKVIERRLAEHGIEEPWMKGDWKEAMGKIEAYERRRLQRKLGIVMEDEASEGVGVGDALDAAIMEGKAMDREARGQPQVR